MTIPTAPTGPRKSQSKNIFIGCLIALGVFVVLVGLGGWWLYSTVRAGFVNMVANDLRPQIVADINASSLPASQKKAAIAAVDRVVLDLEEGRISVFDEASWIDSARGAAHGWVDELELPEAQKTGIKAQFDRLADGTIDGTIGQVEWDRITSEVAESPVAKMIAAWALKVKYIYPSDLPGDEKSAAEESIDRIAKGVVEGKITEPELNQLAKPYETVDPQTGQTVARDLTTDELRELIASLEQLADDKDISTEPWQPDYAGQLKNAIDKGLGVTAGTP